jgi:hypothetical protein
LVPFQKVAIIRKEVAKMAGLPCYVGQRCFYAGGLSSIFRWFD